MADDLSGERLGCVNEGQRRLGDTDQGAEVETGNKDGVCVGGVGDGHEVGPLAE